MTVNSAVANAALKYRIRPAVKSDCRAILALIQELADYEKAPNEVVNTVEQLEKDFNANLFFAYIAELTDDNQMQHDNQSQTSVTGRTIGFALCYRFYSTWKGSCIFLEDLYVQPRARKHGVGLSLITTVVERAASEGSPRVQWQVLDWNKSSIDLYESMGANLLKEWITCRMTPPEMQTFLKQIQDKPNIVRLTQ
jgi:GNAT superfamily N-acetyltransferase